MLSIIFLAEGDIMKTSKKEYLEMTANTYAMISDGAITTNNDLDTALRYNRQAPGEGHLPGHLQQWTDIWPYPALCPGYSSGGLAPVA